MGNAAIRRIPEDLTKCTDAQLRVMINSVIINNPWNDENDDQNEEDSLKETIDIMREKGFRPISPSEYIIELKRQRKENPTSGHGIKVWVPVDKKTILNSIAPCRSFSDKTIGEDKHSYKHNQRSDSPVFASSCTLSIHCTDSKESASSFTLSSIENVKLPSSREHAASEIIKSGTSDAVLSELNAASMDFDDEDNILTEEWPTNGMIHK